VNIYDTFSLEYSADLQTGDILLICRGECIFAIETYSKDFIWEKLKAKYNLIEPPHFDVIVFKDVQQLKDYLLKEKNLQYRDTAKKYFEENMPEVLI
jgi:hypothetical protein